MLGKDDTFKVVLDPATDPGADKRGLLWSGEVLSNGENTGGANSLPSSRPKMFHLRDYHALWCGFPAGFDYMMGFLLVSSVYAED
jgi:hypothetical protein